MRLKKTIAIKILVVLLIYAFIAGYTSGDLALCIGADGHLALESFLHEHCHNHPHIEHDPSAIKHEYDGHVDNPHCKPCVDIPIFIGPKDNRLPLKPAKPNPNILISNFETEVINNSSFTPQAVPQRVLSFADENRFLRSVILIV